MKKLTQVLMLCSVMILSGCNSDKTIATEIRQVKVLKIDPPKRYSVRFQDMKTGEITKEYISKRCSSYKRIVVGGMYKVQVNIKQSSEGHRYEDYTNLKSVFCPK